MSGATTELGLSTAVDSDDNADYLTINLANSLRTVDALFNNVTGHTHAGAHQGGPVAPPAGSITSGMIADGTIVAADLANGAVTNAKLASDTARLNLLTNGGMEVWQRGNGPLTGNPGYTADRWQAYGAASISVTRDTANVDIGSAACAAVVVSSLAGGPAFYQQVKESGLAGRIVSASARVKTSTANAVRLSIGADGSSPATVYSNYHSGSGAYETLTVVGYVPSASATYVQITLAFAVTATAYIDNATLVVGSVAADYAPLHPADDLARCLRYYEQIGDGGDVFLRAPASGAGQVFAQTINYKVRKAVNPTVTKFGTWSVSNTGQPSNGGSSQNSMALQMTSNAAGDTYVFNNAGPSGFTLEANP